LCCAEDERTTGWCASFPEFGDAPFSPEQQRFFGKLNWQKGERPGFLLILHKRLMEC
jgi:hypothetical protein